MPETVKSLKPVALKRGDTIGLAPLAGPFQEEPYQRGVTILRDHGFKVKILQASHPTPYLAGTDHERLTIFHELWKDPEIACILAVRGGYGTMRLLADLDFELIRNHPKPLIGFSDISGLANVIHQRTGLTTFHGPNLTTLCQCDKNSLHSFFHTLTSMVPPEIKADIEVLRSGSSVGLLAGGNLTTINHLLGTPFELDFAEKILVLEDLNEAPYAIDRLFYQLYLAEKFHNLSGLILGNFSKCGPKENIWQMVLDLLKDTDYPIWGNFPVGHKKQNTLWPVGGMARMDSESGHLSYPDQIMLKPV